MNNDGFLLFIPSEVVKGNIFLIERQLRPQGLIFLFVKDNGSRIKDVKVIKEKLLE